MFPGPRCWQVMAPFWRTLRRPGIHASELTYKDVSQEASWKVRGSQEEVREVNERRSTGGPDDIDNTWRKMSKVLVL